MLLEQYALATVPHAAFLLERLTAPRYPKGTNDSGVFLAVGGVDYDQTPRPVVDKVRPERLPVRKAEIVGRRKDGWPALPGTLRESEALLRLAVPRDAVRLQGVDASTARLLKELPRTRWAHIATHGFFEHFRVGSTYLADQDLYLRRGSGERAEAILANPLVLSALVLAGANRLADANNLADDDGGILTAEAIAGLPLPNLELVVLSACETGLGMGTTVVGEGIVGLPRAFHLAGAHDVVASLWKVNDEATTALMAIFYDQLWRQQKPPIEALRNAQLVIYRHPELVGELAKARGTPDFDKLVQRPEPRPGVGHGQGSKDRAPAKQWAAFVLSGWGQ